MTKRFILILVDQMRYDCLEFLNKQHVITPHLNDFSMDSSTYLNAYTSSPSCVPARASIVTGNEPFKNKKVGYIDKTEWNYSTFMQKLTDSNVKTINVGKTHFYPQDNTLGFKINKVYDPQNFNDGYKSDYVKWLQKNNVSSDIDCANTQNNNSYLYYPYTYDEKFHPTNWTADEAVKQLKKIGDSEDFFMQISFHRPHPPYDPPVEYYNMYKHCDIEYFELGDWEKKYDTGIYDTQTMHGKLKKHYNEQMIKSYFAAITHVDYNIGKIINYLKQNNMYNDTQIIFTSDHGEMLGEHNMFRKVVPFNGSCKIPFMYKNNRECIKKNDITSLIDLAPTILDYFDIKDFKCDGLVIDSTKYKQRNFIFGEHTYVNDGWFYVIDNQYKYIWNSISGEEYLFDIINDEKELNNILNNVCNEKLKIHMTNKLKEQYGSFFFNNNKLVSGKKVDVFGNTL